jgi:hypothetical protein
MPEADLVRIGQSLALRDIHLPPVPGGWPPAPGWWLLTGLSATLTLLLLLLWQRGRRLRYRRQALRQLTCLAQTNEISSHVLLAELSTLLKRAALCAFPDEHCAGLSGEAWLCFLDRSLADTLFTTGVGRCLASGPYQQAVEIDHEALLNLCRRWLRRLPPAPSRGRTG